MANEIAELTVEAGKDVASIAATLALAASNLGPSGMKADGAKSQATENYRFFLRLLLDKDAKEAAEKAEAEKKAAEEEARAQAKAQREAEAAARKADEEESRTLRRRSRED